VQAESRLFVPTSRREIPHPLNFCLDAPVRLMDDFGDCPLISSTSITDAIFSLVLVAVAVIPTFRHPAGVNTEVL
jgi:hypothetical protein